MLKKNSEEENLTLPPSYLPAAELIILRNVVKLWIILRTQNSADIMFYIFVLNMCKCMHVPLYNCTQLGVTSLHHEQTIHHELQL